MKKFLAFFIFCLVLTGTTQAALLNGDFNSGLTSWITGGTANDVIVPSSPIYTGMNGNYAILGSNVASGTSLLRQQFAIPTTYPTIKISFDYYFGGFDQGTGNDVLTAQIRDFVYFIKADGSTGKHWNDWLIILNKASNNGNAFGTFIGYYPLDSDLVTTPAGVNNGEIRFNLNEVANLNTDTFFAVDNINVSAVPEPTSLSLLGLGLLGIFGFKRRKA